MRKFRDTAILLLVLVTVAFLIDTMNPMNVNPNDDQLDEWIECPLCGKYLLSFQNIDSGVNCFTCSVCSRSWQKKDGKLEEEIIPDCPNPGCLPTPLERSLPIRNSKQRYLCLRCSKRYIDDGGLTELKL